ncbi:hypothetical protein MKX01_030884 [Papaver californicum]|nr:hypothetical protein MKX01_030884 [Papaver californicum]
MDSTTAVPDVPIASVLILFGLFMLGAYTSHLLGICLATDVRLRSYADIEFLAFGKTGRYITLLFVNMESFMSLVSFTISMTDHLTRILDRYPNFHISFFSLSTAQSITVIAIIVSIPTVWLRNLENISFISIFSILLSFLICTCIFGGVKPNKVIHFFRIKNIFSLSGLYIFNITSHMAIPNVYRSMVDPTRFSTISFISFSAVSTLYVILVSQVTLSMPSHLVLTQIALWIAVIIPMTKYVFFSVPMATEKRTVIRGAAESLFLVIFLVLSITVPFFETVLGLTGSLISIFVSIILTISFYLRIFRKTIPLPSLVIHLIIMVICLVIGISNTRSMIKHYE